MVEITNRLCLSNFFFIMKRKRKKPFVDGSRIVMFCPLVSDLSRRQHQFPHMHLSSFFQLFFIVYFLVVSKNDK